MTLFRLLLGLLPRDLRETWGDEMAALLARRLAESEGAGDRFRHWLGAVADVVVQSAAVRLRGMRSGAAGRTGAPARPTGGGGGVEGLRQDARYAWRALRRSPGHALAVVATLTLGIGAPVAVFTVVDGVLLRPPPYADADALVMVNGLVMDLGDSAWADAPPVLASLARWGLGAGTVVSPGGPERVTWLAVEPSFFSTLGVDAARGRLFGSAEDRPDAPPVAVVSDRYRRRAWGEDATPMGRALELDGRVFEVVGSMPPGFGFFRYEDADLWIPLAQHPAERTPSGLGRLAPGVDVGTAAGALEEFARSRLGEPEPPGGAPVVRLHGVREALVGELRGPLLVFLGASALVLMIAVANASNLVLARSVRRRPELAVRRAVGAARGRLVRQLVLEAGLLSATAALPALALALGATHALLRLGTHVVPGVMDVSVDLRAVAFAAAVAVLATVGAGLAPALLALRDGGAGGERAATATRGGRRFEAALVATETALTLVLLVGTGVLLRTFLELRPGDPGFTVPDRAVVTFDLPDHRYPDGGSAAAFVDRVLQALVALPGVREAEVVTDLPLTGLSNYVPATPDGPTADPAARPTYVHFRSATAGYLELMGIAPVRGRPARGPDEVVVNEAAVRRFWPGVASPLGRTLSTSVGDTARVRTVVGVVPDARIFGGTTESRPEAYATYASEPLARFHVVLATSLPVDRTAVRRAVDGVDAGVPLLEVATLAAVIAPSARVPRFQVGLVGTLALLALLLAALGTFAVLSHAAARRTREMGIRVALGAGRWKVVGLVLRGGLGPTALGLAVGLVLSLLLQGVLERTFLRVGGVDAPVIVGAAVLLAAVASAAALRPALRASAVQPMAVLREE